MRFMALGVAASRWIFLPPVTFALLRRSSPWCVSCPGIRPGRDAANLMKGGTWAVVKILQMVLNPGDGRGRISGLPFLARGLSLPTDRLT